jgi:hypothetical protein
MPKATCPACKCEVKYSKDADIGSTVKCPECDEVFTPPKLKTKEKKYDPAKDEDTYKVGRATSNQDEKDKTRKASAAHRAAERQAREQEEMFKEHRRATFFGPEVWLIIFAIGAGAGLPFGLWLARSWDKLGDYRVLLIIVVLIAVMFAAAGAAGSAWAWLRQNRD